MKDIAKDFAKAGIRFGCTVGRVFSTLLNVVGLMFELIGNAAKKGGEKATDSLNSIEMKQKEKVSKTD